MSSTAKARSKAVLLTAAVLTAVALGCNSREPCGMPGVVASCQCGGAARGSRVCTTHKIWAPCDCSGAIPLPRLSPPGAGDAGMRIASSTGGSSGSARPSGTGGAPPVTSDDDAGMEPMSHGGTGGRSGGASGSGGAGGASGFGGAGGAPAEPMSAAYGACMSASDCHAGAQCIITASFPTDASVCAPACVDVGECPTPEGSYEALLGCLNGSCMLDCTPVLFLPLLTCPTGMSCISPLFGTAYCQNDGP
jgi:hypothetical protein